VDAVVPVFDNMMAQGLLGQAPALFAFWLNRTAGTGVGIGGELTLGGVDPAHYSGNINWVCSRRVSFSRVSLNICRCL
jgi:hypothetical protein